MCDPHHAKRAGSAAPEQIRADPAGLAPLGAAATASGGLTAVANDEGPTGTNGQAFRDRYKANRLDFDANRVREPDKCFATMRAKLAISGWAVQIVDDGRGGVAYWVSRWGQSRTLPSRHALKDFVLRVGCAGTGQEGGAD